MLECLNGAKLGSPKQFSHARGVGRARKSFDRAKITDDHEYVVFQQLLAKHFLKSSTWAIT